MANHSASGASDQGDSLPLPQVLTENLIQTTHTFE